ncbi:MAG: SUKH-3 domain-containing protein [Actinocatenispora sp.]
MTAPMSEAAQRDLREAGWQPGRRLEAETAEAIRQTCEHVGRQGQRHEPFPAAVAALNEFGGITAATDRPGVAVAPQPFVIDPTLAAASTETLADVASVLGVRLFPLGLHGELEALLAIDERGRVFAVDDTGEWFLGDSIHSALDGLLTGQAPLRVHDDGSLGPGRR